MNDIAERNSGGMTVAERMKSLRANTATSLRKGGGGTDPFMKLARDGVWCFGQDNIELPEGTKVLINANTLSHGWVSWEDGRPAGETMVSMLAAAPPPAAELPDAPGEPWQPQVGVLAVIMDGKHKGTQVAYKGTSQGMLQAFGDLVEEIAERVDSGEEEELNPLVALETSHYSHKKYGRIYKPVLTTVGWMSHHDTQVPEEEEEEEEKEEAPVRRRRRPSAA